MTIFQKTMRMTIAAGGLAAMTGTYASGAALTVGDASFEDHNIDSHAGSADYAYSDDGGSWVDGFSPSAGGDSAWTSREAAGNAGWLYNTAYATATNRSAPRTGDQAFTTSSSYTYQVLGDTFAANTTYTFSVYASDIRDDLGRIFLYIYDGTVVTDGGDDADNLATSGGIDFDHTDDPGSPNGDWRQYSVQYTTGAAGGEIGNQIGVSFWGSGNVFIDDVSLDAGPVPEPGSLALIALGGLMLARRRRNA